MTRSVRVTVSALVLAVAVTIGGWFAFLRDGGPSEAAGRAWLDGFATLLTSPQLLGARGPAALSLFPRLGTWPATGCQTTWSRSGGLGPTVVSQTLELASPRPEPCEQAQFGQLRTVLRQSEGVTPGALVELLTGQFGTALVHRDTSLNGTISYEWDVLYAIHIRVEEPVRPGGADTFTVAMTRFLGAPTAVPSAADGERWMDRTVDLLTGPGLPDARGMAAVRLADDRLVAEPTLGDDCATLFSFGSPTVTDAIGYSKWLTLQYDVANCAEAGFSSLSITVWQREPVTVDAMVKRLEARLGTARLSRAPDFNTLRYEWTARPGTVIGINQPIEASPAAHMFLISLSRERTP